MNRIISHADFVQVLQNGNDIWLKFQTVVPETEYTNGIPTGTKEVVVQDVSVFMDAERAKQLIHLLSEYTVGQ